MPDAPLSLPALLALIEEATPGPWLANELIGGSWEIVDDASMLAWLGPVSLNGRNRQRDANYIATADPPTVLALCEALRIAVGVLVWATENYTPTHDERLRDRNDGCWCVSCESRRTLARVRELVDLGEKP